MDQFSRFYRITSAIGAQQAFILGLFLGGAGPETIEALTGVSIDRIREIFLAALTQLADESLPEAERPPTVTHR